MTGRGGRLIGLVGACAITLVVNGQSPVFRADAEAVTVNVSVKRGNTPVQGLAAADFRLYDNDVLQQIAAVSLDAVPVDVSIVIDGSASTFPDHETARQAVRGMAGFLRPSDRVRVLITGNSVISAIPWRPPGDLDTSRIQLLPGNISLVSDGVLVALFHRTSPDRRHLVVSLADGDDLCSIVSGDSLRRGAERSGAVLHWISVQLKRGQEREWPVTDALHSICRWADRPFNMRPALSDAARSTGGTTHTAWYGADVVAVEAFDRVFDDFRQSYVLHYVPQGVERTGWHRLRVNMSTRGYTVRARPGYWGAGTAAERTR